MIRKYPYILLLLFVGISHAYPKGIGGTYQLCMTILDDATKSPLSNTVLVMNGDTVKTDVNGNIVYDVKWETACGFRLNIIQRWKASNRMNPKYILITKDGCSKQIKNRWRKYGRRQHGNSGRKPYEVRISWCT